MFDIVKEIDDKLNELKCAVEADMSKTVIESRYDHLAGYIACALHAQIISHDDFRRYTKLSFDTVYGDGAWEDSLKLK